MTISTAGRRLDLLKTLDAMVTAVRDAAVIHVVFIPGERPVETTLLTTWEELLQRGLIQDESSFVQVQYSLTPVGWVSGLLTREPEDLEECCGRLAGALKRHVKGRERDGLTVLKEIVAASGLPEGWVWNAVQGNLLDRRFPRCGFYLRGFEDGIACHLRVPRTFGLEEL